MGYLKEAIRYSWQEINKALSIFLSLWVVPSMLFDKKTLWLPVCVSLGVFFIILVGMIIGRYRDLKKGEVTRKLLHNHRVHLIRNDFQLCADDLLLRKLTQEQLDSFVMVMGIDCSGNMSINTRRGVAHHMMKYLDEHYTVHNGKPSDEVQRQIDAFCAAHPTGDEVLRLNFCTCVDIRMELEAKNGPWNPIPCNLLMVANSRKKSYGKDMIKEGIDHDGKANLVIPAVFNHIKERNQYTSLLIPIIGSNGLRQPYLSLFSQIVNQFVWVGVECPEVHLNDVYIAIREADYQGNWNVSLSQLESYLHECSTYYPKRAE